MINFKNPCLDTLQKTEKPKTPQTKEQTKTQSKYSSQCPSPFPWDYTASSELVTGDPHAKYNHFTTL